MSKIKNLSANAATIFEKAKAGYSAILFVTDEDTRTQREIQEAGLALDRDMYIWRYGTGLSKLGDKKGTIYPDTETPTSVLEKMFGLGKGSSGVARSIVILRDFHDFLEDPMVRSRMKDVIQEYKVSGRMIIVTAPTAKMPRELEKEFALLEGGLPNDAQIDLLISGMISGGNLKEDQIPTKEVRDHLVKSALGLTSHEAENALSLSLVRPRVRGVGKEWDPKIVLEEKCLSLRKSGLLEYIPVPDDGMKQVGGLDNLKEWIWRRRNAFTPEARKFGLPAPKGILTVGPPGSGKTLCAKAISSTLGWPLLRWDVARSLGSLVGQSEQNVRDTIQIAEALSPCILWIDEIEKGLAGSSAGSLDSGVGARVMGTILTWMSEKTSPVFVYATANDVTSLPPELLRKGRFDEMFSVSLPGPEERKEIFAIHIADKGRKGLVESGVLNLDELSDESEGYSGSEIKSCIEEALFTAFSKSRDLVQSDILEALEHATPISQTMSERLGKLAEWCKYRTRPANRPTESVKSGRAVEAN